MYSGTTLTKFSGRLIGAHQKIDSVARRHLAKITGENGKKIFPPIRSILKFEGKNGPDAIKRKSPARDEPWHYFSPFDEGDSNIVGHIKEHYDLLITQLKADNKERASFEAAWLAHAIVDGLTPAHHFPYEEKLTELRGGKGIESRTSYKEKLVMPGENRRQKFKNNWKFWGGKGLFTTHMLFEWGVAAIIKPLTFNDAVPTKSELEKIKQIGIVDWFRRTAREIAVLDMYDRYYRRGWSIKLTLDVRQRLAPSIIKAVTLTWYSALEDAGLIS